jgi:hypothetical protein
MNDTNENQLKEYLQNVSVLFANIENWSVKRGLEVNLTTEWQLGHKETRSLINNWGQSKLKPNPKLSLLRRWTG